MFALRYLKVSGFLEVVQSHLGEIYVLAVCFPNHNAIVNILMSRVNRFELLRGLLMFTLFSGRHIGGLRRSSNMEIPYQALQFQVENLDEYLNFGTPHTPQTLLRELSSLFIAYNISRLLDFIHCMVYDFILYCVTMHTHTLY